MERTHAYASRHLRASCGDCWMRSPLLYVQRRYCAVVILCCAHSLFKAIFVH